MTYLTEESRRILALSGTELLEMNGEADHIHLMISAPPQICLANVINSLKSATSRLVRKKYAEHLARFYWKPYFWNRSYLILSSGGAPIEVIQKYIQDQEKK
jgi:transposase IS200-family protein